MATLVRQFNEDWRDGMDHVHLNVVRHFGDNSSQSAFVAAPVTAASLPTLDSTTTTYSAGAGAGSTSSTVLASDSIGVHPGALARASTSVQVLKKVLTQLILYYQRFVCFSHSFFFFFSESVYLVRQGVGFDWNKKERSWFLQTVFVAT